MRRKRAVCTRRDSRNAAQSRRLLNQVESARCWQRSFSELAPLAIGAISATQRQAGETLELMGRSTQAKVGLLHQAFRAAQDPNPFTSHAKWVGFWMSALSLAQTNTATMLRIHSRTIDSWLRLMGGRRVVTV